MSTANQKTNHSNHAGATILTYHPDEKRADQIEKALQRLISESGATLMSCLSSAEIKRHIERQTPVIIVVPLHKELFSILNGRLPLNVRVVVWDNENHATLPHRAQLILNGVRSVARGDDKELRNTVHQLILELAQENEHQSNLLKLGERNKLIGKSPAWLRVLDEIEAMAPQHKVPVLVQGRSGTGKEFVTRALHKESKAQGPLLTLNCAQIRGDLVRSELFGHTRGSFTGADATHHGMFEKAKGGTIFLDDIQTLDLITQGMLLRVLQEGVILPVGSTTEVGISDVRLIVATNIDLTTAILNGTFREDLYYRLNVLQINLPSLNERGHDINLLTDYFFAKYTEEYERIITDIAEEVLIAFQTLAWRGNVRQLENVIRNVVIRKKRGTTVNLEDLPADILRELGGESFGQGEEKAENDDSEHLVMTEPVSYERAIETMERWLIPAALRKFNGNQSNTAKFLGITRGKIRDRVARFGITLAKEIGFDLDDDDTD